MSDLISRQAAIDAAKILLDYYGTNDITKEFADNVAENFMNKLPSADRPQEWIPCEKQLPRVGIRVLLCLTNGQVLIGHRDRPDLVWQVTEKDGRRHWVYDPEAYTDDIDSLPKAEDCGFSQDSDYADGFLSVTSVNYNKMFSGVVAWMPLPKPWKGADDED